MSIVAQIGIVVLIGCIILIIIRSNRALENAAREGENFVDEWELQQQRKEERLQRKEEKRLAQKAGRKSISVMEEEEDELTEPENTETEYTVEKEEPQEAFSNIISMEQYKNPGLVLVEMDENHRPLRRIAVKSLPFTIGRSEDNALVLDDLCVARKHGVIVAQEGACILKDVGTANKIFVNGAVTDQVVLSDNLRFYIGNVELMAEMEEGRSSQTRLYRNVGEQYYD